MRSKIINYLEIFKEIYGSVGLEYWIDIFVIINKYDEV